MATYNSVATGNFTAETTWGSTWAASTAYALGDMVTPSTLNGYIYECTTAGTSDVAEPTWPTVIGSTVTDGTAVWTCRSAKPTTGDSFTVTAATTVTYDNGDSTDDFEAVTLNGKLAFPAAANSTLQFSATGTLTINSGGELEIGTSLAPIGASYHAHVYWAQGTATRYVLTLNDGGIITIYGDPAYYSSTRKITLAADWDASLGNTLYVTGNQTTTWPVGAKFWLNKGYASGSYAGSTDYQTDSDIFEIASIGAYDSVNDQTPITVVAGHGSLLTFLSGQQLLCVSRNVELADPGASWDVYGYYSYSEYIRLDNNQASANTNININDCIFRGWDRACDSGYNFIGSNLVFVSNNYGIYSGTNHQVTGDFVSNYYGVIYGTNHQVTGDFVSNYRGINSGTNHQVTGYFVSNYRGINSGTNHQVTGDFVSNNYGIYQGTNHQVTGDFVSNNYGIYQGTNHQVTGDFVSNTTDISLANQNIRYNTVLELCTFAGADKRDLRVYKNSGNILPLVSTDIDWVAPPSANDWELQFLPNSYCNDSRVGQLELSPLREMAAYATTTNIGLSFQIYPVGWTTALTNTDILIQARYLDSATGITRTTVTTAAATYTNNVWNELSVTIAPAQDGIVYFNVFLRKYESGCYVILDPVWTIS